MANANVQKTGKKNEITLEELFFWKQWSGNDVGTGEWIESTAYSFVQKHIHRFPLSFNHKI